MAAMKNEWSPRGVVSMPFLIMVMIVMFFGSLLDEMVRFLIVSAQVMENLFYGEEDGDE